MRQRHRKMSVALFHRMLRVPNTQLQLKFALNPLFDLVTRYPPTPSHLTALHPLFLRVRKLPFSQSI